MVAILVFIMATLTKKTVGRKGPFGGTFSKIGQHIDYNNSHGGLGHQVQESWPYLSNVTLLPYLLSHVKNEFSPVEFRDSPLQKRAGDWGELTFAKTSGNVTINKEKNWPIADRRVPNNDPRNNCGTDFGSSPPLVCKVVNGHLFNDGSVTEVTVIK